MSFFPSAIFRSFFLSSGDFFPYGTWATHHASSVLAILAFLPCVPRLLFVNFLQFKLSTPFLLDSGEARWSPFFFQTMPPPFPSFGPSFPFFLIVYSSSALKTFLYVSYPLLGVLNPSFLFFRQTLSSDSFSGHYSFSLSFFRFLFLLCIFGSRLMTARAFLLERLRWIRTPSQHFFFLVLPATVISPWSVSFLLSDLLSVFWKFPFCFFL